MERLNISNLTNRVDQIDKQTQYDLEDEAVAANAVLTILARQERVLLAPQDMLAMRHIKKILQSVPSAVGAVQIKNGDTFPESKVLASVAKAIADDAA